MNIVGALFSWFFRPPAPASSLWKSSRRRRSRPVATIKGFLPFTRLDAHKARVLSGPSLPEDMTKAGRAE